MPDVPVMVSGYCPTGAELDTVNVKALLLVVGFVPKEAVTPVGRPEIERFTLPVKPY